MRMQKQEKTLDCWHNAEELPVCSQVWFWTWAGSTCQDFAAVEGSQCVRTPHYPYSACSFAKKKNVSHPSASTIPKIPLVGRKVVCEGAKKRDETFLPMNSCAFHCA